MHPLVLIAAGVLLLIDVRLLAGLLIVVALFQALTDRRY